VNQIVNVLGESVQVVAKEGARGLKLILQMYSERGRPRSAEPGQIS
jgi:hypothetical protein